MSGTLLWFCGLPGSGKSTVSRLVVKMLERRGVKVVYLSMDEIRKEIIPNPTYSDEERDVAYRAFVLIGSTLCSNGHNVVLDATAHKRMWRDLAREKCAHFAEVYVKCPVEICIERETRRKGQNNVRAKLYLDALKRLRTGKKMKGLGKVPGVDEPFEESDAEIVVDSSREKVEAIAKQVIDKIENIRFPIFA